MVLEQEWPQKMVDRSLIEEEPKAEKG